MLEEITEPISLICEPYSLRREIAPEKSTTASDLVRFAVFSAESPKDDISAFTSFAPDFTASPFSSTLIVKSAIYRLFVFHRKAK